MSLTADLIDQFVQATNDEKQEVSDGIAYGTVVIDGESTYVQLDGSTYNTPVTTTTNVKHGERVSVLIKDHTVTITGNFSSPADSTSSLMSSINSFDMAVGKKITTEELTANSAFIKFLLSDKIVAEDIVAANAKIDALEVDKLTVEDLKAVYGNFDALDAYFAQLGVATIDKATIKELNATSGHFRELHVDYGEFERITAAKGVFDDIVTDTIEAQIINGTALDVKYANIDFANIGEAAITKLFSESGIIKDLIVSEGKITGELVGVTIRGDLIEAGTLRADKLVVLGSDGKYYKLSTDFTAIPGVEPVEEDKIHGSSLVANSITAEKIAVDDLVAFGATIGGFKMTADSLYSDVKSAVNNDTRGIYADTTGQFAVGDANNFLKFYRDTDGKYKLGIKASEIILESGKNIETAINDAIANVTVEYALSSSKDTPPTNYADGNCDVEVTLNDDGTQTLSIVSIGTVRNHNATLVENDDGTYILVVADAGVSDGENHGASLIQNSDGTYKLAVTQDNDGTAHNIEIVRNTDGTSTLSVAKVNTIGHYHVTATENDDGTQTLSIDDAEGWSEVSPSWTSGKYVWTRNKIVYSNPPRIGYTTPICDTSWSAVNDLEEESKEHVHDQISSVNKKLTDDKISLESMIERNATKINSLDSLVETIRGKLQRIVTDEDEKKMTMFEQSEDSYIFNFFEKQQTQTDAINAYQGAVVIGKDEVTGDPNITIQSAAEASIKLKLNNDDISFLDKSNKEIGVISADTEGRLGIAVDNETVTGELRQSNPSAPDGEFVWQVRRNGNYGLSWKEKVKV